MRQASAPVISTTIPTISLRTTSRSRLELIDSVIRWSSSTSLVFSSKALLEPPLFRATTFFLEPGDIPSFPSYGSTIRTDRNEEETISHSIASRQQRSGKCSGRRLDERGDPPRRGRPLRPAKRDGRRDPCLGSSLPAIITERGNSDELARYFALGTSGHRAPDDADARRAGPRLYSDGRPLHAGDAGHPRPGSGESGRLGDPFHQRMAFRDALRPLLRGIRIRFVVAGGAHGDLPRPLCFDRRPSAPSGRPPPYGLRILGPPTEPSSRASRIPGAQLRLSDPDDHDARPPRVRIGARLFL